MKKQWLMILVLGLFWMGCNQDSNSLLPQEEEIVQIQSTENSQEEINLRRNNQPRPFKGTIVYEQVAANGLECGCTNGQLVQIEGSGTVTHLGRVSSATSYCLLLGAAQNCPGPGALVNNACLTITAANGDEINLDVLTPYETCITACCFEASIQGTFNGGTGRFDDASGTWTAEIIQELGSPVSTVTVDGQITY
jgi:hypothetical protein